MQMLETIQEYVPFKHSFGYFSSWIGSKYSDSNSHSAKDEKNNEKEDQESIAESNKDDVGSEKGDVEAPEGNKADTSEPQSQENEEIENPVSQEVSMVDAGENKNLPNNHLSGSSQNDVSFSQNEDDNLPNENSTGFLKPRGSLENTAKIETFLYNNIPNGECSCQSDSEIDNTRPDKRRYANEKNLLRGNSRSFKLPIFLKRRKKKKRSGNTWNENPTNIPGACCDCAVGGDDLCLVHLKSKSESDINTSRYKLSEDYYADLSDISVTSFSLAEDDSNSSNGSYVDIDLRKIRKTLLDSGSWNNSDLESLELSSNWSEIHRTISDPSLGDDCLSLAEECRESDIPDTASDISRDSRSQVSRVHRKLYQGRRKILPLPGHHVNESFVENECFCCHCTIM